MNGITLTTTMTKNKWSIVMRIKPRKNRNQISHIVTSSPTNPINLTNRKNHKNRMNLTNQANPKSQIHHRNQTTPNLFLINHQYQTRVRGVNRQGRWNTRKRTLLKEKQSSPLKEKWSTQLNMKIF